MSQSSGVWVPTLSRSALFLLLACLHFLPTQSAVLVQSGNLTLNTLSDMPANFGPSVPPEGVVGLLLLAAPDDEACEPLNTPQAGKKQPWIALIARSHDRDGCTFDVKVRNAAAAGAVAAIVHDDTTEALLIMAKPPRHPHPSIPAVFISVESGLLLRKLMNAEKIHVIITPLADVLWVSMLLSACAGALAVSLLLGAFWWVRRPILMVEGRRGFHRSHGAPRIVMTSEQLRALPTILHGDPALPCLAPLESPAAASSVANSTVESCVVCLERYQVGEKLRVLPCNHRYHAACIDQWLSCRRPVCPVCKADARFGGSHPSNSRAAATSAARPGRRALVLAWLRNRWTNEAAAEELAQDGRDVHRHLLTSSGVSRQRSGSSATTFNLGQALPWAAATPSNFPHLPAALEASTENGEIENEGQAGWDLEAGQRSAAIPPAFAQN